MEVRDDSHVCARSGGGAHGAARCQSVNLATVGVCACEPLFAQTKEQQMMMWEHQMEVHANSHVCACSGCCMLGSCTVCDLQVW